jgi:hypothetical protein
VLGNFFGGVRTKKRAPRVKDENRDPVEFARVRLGFEPDERQALVLRSNAKRGILNCSRQWGKSTVAAVMAVHRAYSRAGSLVLVASPSGRQSAEFLGKAEELARKLGIVPRGDGHNEISLLFPNGSRIVGLPATESTGRGFSKVSLLLIDEAARMEDRLYRMLRPMLAVGQGDLWLMSTPCGKRGFFYETWAFGGPEWLKVSATVLECERISKAYLEEERGAMGAMSFAQEFLCEFTGSEGSLFDRDLVEACLDDSVKPLDIAPWKDLMGR